jgi:hypothetical protein
MRLVRRVLATAVATLVLAQPGTAVADTVTRSDAVGDVARSPIGSSSYLPSPSRIEGDITSTRVSHGPHLIRITIALRELTTTSNGNFNQVLVLSNRRFRAIELDAFPGHWEGHLVTTTATGRIVGCAVTHRIDYDLNLVHVRVPRTCLGRPRLVRWVRVAVRTTVAGTAYAYADDARATGYAATPVYGPKVLR